MTGLPDTRSPGPRRAARPWRIVLPLVAASLLAAALATNPDGNAPPQERIYSPNVEDVAVRRPGGGEDSSFPPGTRALSVQVRVRDLPPGRRLAASVERSGRSSGLDRLLGGDNVRATGGPEERLSVSQGRASGIVAFGIGAADGGALPDGGYAVEVRDLSRADDRVLARASFRVGG